MNQRLGIISIIAAFAVVGIVLGTSYSNTSTSSALSVTPSTIDRVTPQTIDSASAGNSQSAGGVEFNMFGANAIPLDQVAALKAAGRTVHEVTLTAQSVDLPIPGGKMYHGMTFDGQVPGPTIRATQGDVIEVTLNVPSTEVTGHSLDMHASRISAVPNFGPVMPGKSNTYAFIAQTPGAFKYHCEGVGVIGMDQHVLSGMYGMVIIDPLNGYHKLLKERTATVNGKVVLNNTLVSPAAYEFTLEYNQLYIDDNGSYNQDAMFKHDTTWTVVNGKPFGYDPVVTKVWNNAKAAHDRAAPLIVPVGQHVRFFIVNQGNMPVFFHIVGSQMDRVTQGNVVQAMGTQTWEIGGSQDAIVDAIFDEPGAYVAVNHDYAAIFSGAASVILAKDAPAPNPSDAVPPDSTVPGTSIHQDTFVHCECTDERASEISSMINSTSQ
ncbi:MAG TPA: multicopper oxidase domain-containing protein [Candidatus Nitrosotalea sp.]|nr:multicopper oxidase domain-containing protein [Candidatus Nitrosotalea sp.]